MICNSCKKYSVRSDMEAIGLCVHCLALAVKDQQIADLTAQVAKLQADQEKRYKAYADIERQKIDLKAQVAECRMYLRGCLGHHFDDTPIEQVAKDVSRAYHKRVAAEEDLKAQIAETGKWYDKLSDYQVGRIKELLEDQRIKGDPSEYSTALDCLMDIIN